MTDAACRDELVEAAWVAAFTAYLCGALPLENLWAIEAALDFPPQPPPVPGWARLCNGTAH
jgi:hypothetical protein